MRGLLAWLILAVAAVAPASARPVAIGVASLHMVDASRADPLHPERRREWMVDLYYPGVATRHAKRGLYAPDPALISRMIADQYYGVPEATMREWTARQGPAFDRIPARAGRLPLITLSPGWGVAALNYAEVASDLARRGYVVAVIDHPYIGYSRLPGGRMMLAGDDPAMQNEDPASWAPRVREWAQDVTVTIDHILRAGVRPGLRVDARRIVATGHSLGGTIAVEVCSHDPRVSGCMDFEGAPEGTTAAAEGPRKPTLFTMSRSAKPDRPFVTPRLDQPPLDFLAKGGGNSNWAVAVRGGSHMSFSDAPREMPDTLSRFGGTLMSPQRSLEVYAGMVDAFARAYFPHGGGDGAFEAWLTTIPEAKARRSGER